MILILNHNLWGYQHDLNHISGRVQWRPFPVKASKLLDCARSDKFRYFGAYV